MIGDVHPKEWDRRRKEQGHEYQMPEGAFGPDDDDEHACGNGDAEQQGMRHP